MATIAPRLQAKLKIGAPNDRFEQEADRMAEEVMRQPQPRAPETAAQSRSARSPGRIQRSCQEREEQLGRHPVAIQRECKECEEELSSRPAAIQRACSERDDESHVRSAEEATIHVSDPPGRDSGVAPEAARIDALRAGGQPLSPPLRAFFEPRFGHDFGRIRIHTEAGASESARSLNARAYTVGHHIVFSRGEYASETAVGRRLLAHELAHTIQQEAGTGSPVPILQRTIGDGHDLRSPRFAGDSVLEAVFDDERLLHLGNRGEAVRKIQQALVDAGFALPRFGVDGIFGLETRGAVKQFQTVFDLLVDGIVGPQTMGRLDEHYETPNPPPICPVVPSETVAPFEAAVEVTTPPSECRVPPGRPLGKGCPTPGTSGVTGIHEAQEDFSGRSTTRFGVGEFVRLSFDTTRSEVKALPPAKRAEFFGGGRWVKTSGPGSVSVTAADLSAGTGTFTADQNDGTVTLELQVAAGRPCIGSPVAEVQFDIVKPDDGAMEQEPGTKIVHKQGTWSVGFLGRSFLRPRDVSFRQIELREGSTRARADGFLSDLNGREHPLGNPRPVGPGDSTTGSRVRGFDTVLLGPKDPPFSAGRFLWAIPWEFRVGGGTFEEFTTANQLATADANGTATIQKKGAGPFTVVASAPTVVDFF